MTLMLLAAACTRVGAGLACTSNSPVVTSLANRLLGDTGSSSGRPVYASQAGTDAALSHGNHSWEDYSAVDWVWHQSGPTERLAADSQSRLLEAPAAKGTAWLPLAAKGRNNAALHVQMNNRTGDWADLGTGHGEVTAATLEVQFHYGRCDAFGPGTFSQTYGSILTVILHINDVPCCWNQAMARRMMAESSRTRSSLR